MIAFNGQAILLDIEGTTSSISYVKDVMFPFVGQNVASFLNTNWASDPVQNSIDQMALDAGLSRVDWLGDLPDEPNSIVTKVNALMDGDSKTTGLKSLQGQIWKAGFESGQLQGHLYQDTAPAIKSWNESGIKVFIYSSGSIAAQKLYFGFSEAGDLLDQFAGHFDTTIGNKKESPSYQNILNEIGLAGDQVLFVSDVVAELEAAKESGLQTAHSIRPGNVEEDSLGHPSINSFSEIQATQLQ